VYKLHFHPFFVPFNAEKHIFHPKNTPKKAQSLKECRSNILHILIMGLFVPFEMNNIASINR
jgi:hypothetical protein